jgi:polar amino acid transport system substrate-binding protein
MVDSPVAGFTAKTAGAGKYFEVAVDPANPSGYEPALVGIGVLKLTPELRDAIKAALESALKDGSYKAVLDKYGLAAGALTKITINAGK